jgi:hypothetical protein
MLIPQNERAALGTLAFGEDLIEVRHRDG